MAKYYTVTTPDTGKDGKTRFHTCPSSSQGRKSGTILSWRYRASSTNLKA